MWDYLKTEVFKRRPRNLKPAIREEYGAYLKLAEKVAERFRMRFQQCIDNQGHYLLLLHIMVKLRKKYYPIIEQVIKINML